MGFFDDVMRGKRRARSRREPIHDLTNDDELRALFGDLPSKGARYRFDGIKFDLSHHGAGLTVAATLVGGAFTGAVVKRLRERPYGTYGRLWFPEPAGLDLNVQPHLSDEGPRFEDRYEMSSRVPKLAARFLGELPRVLTDLWPSYFISVHDEHIDIGPLLGTPEESASAIGDLVGAIHTPTYDSEIGEDVDPASLDSFCFYCGHLVRSDCPKCPACDGDLRGE